MFGLLPALCLLQASNRDFRPDFDELINEAQRYGAYVRADGVDFAAIREAYRPKFERVADKDALLDLLEHVVGELHDFHAMLGTNNGKSPRVVPSGTDLYARWVGDEVLLDQIRQDSLAERAGLIAGDRVLSINGMPPRSAAKLWIGANPPNRRAWDWALNSALAGRWNQDREITVLHDGKTRTVRLKTAESPRPKSRLTARHLVGGLLYLRPENSLGDNALIADFDRMLLELQKARGVVLDLRNTPSGGNSSVARGIMGLFISQKLPFQRHVIDERDTNTIRDWVEYATPRASKPVKTKLIILVGRWTGSMGEGIAIGLDAMHRGIVIGTRMAGLRGAVDSFTLPLSGYNVFFPTEQIFHINGTPRHEWIPPIVVTPSTDDVWMKAALKYLAIRS